MERYLIICPFLFLSGLVDSIAGGGGLISFPAYVLAGVPMHVILGTSKLGAFPGAIVAAWRFAKSGYVKWKQAIPCGILGFLGAALGANIALHLSAAQVEEAVLEANILVGDVAIQLEGQHSGAVEHRHGAGVHLNLTGSQIGVRSINLIRLQAGYHLTAHLNHTLNAKILSIISKIGIILRVEHNLSFSCAVTEVDENHTTMVAYGIHPANKRHLLADITKAELFARMGTVTVHICMLANNLCLISQHEAREILPLSP